MNKQEFSKKIVSWGSWCTDVHDGKKDRYVKISKVQEFIEELDEPQKVKVPQFVAEWFEENKHNLNFAIYELCEAGKVPVDLYEGLSAFERWFYLNHDIETLIRMQDGYEVEEEPKWVVYGERGYLTSLSISKGKSTGWTGNGDKHGSGAIHFDDKEMAQYTAYITGGTVEKV